jgi:hypothetical protein
VKLTNAVFEPEVLPFVCALTTPPDAIYTVFDTIVAKLAAPLFTTPSLWAAVILVLFVVSWLELSDSPNHCPASH